MTPTAHPVAVQAADLPPRVTPSADPEPFASRMAGRSKRALGAVFGLANFGVNLTELAPGAVSALPSRQRAGIGSALIRSALRRMRDAGVGGCVVLGDPACYGRFGFAARAGLIYPGVPAAHFMALAQHDAVPVGEVAYHPAFSQDAP